MTRKFAPSWKHHIERYAFALPYCYRKDVMDAGCQTGFGANILSHVTATLMLVDNNQQNLDLANELYRPHCKTTHVLCDFEKDFPALTDGIDTVVAFELIEHLEFPDVFLKNVAKNLRVGGKLVFSVPHMVENREHKHLYSAETIQFLIGKYFNLMEFYSQERGAIDGKPLYKGLICHVGVGVKR